MLDRQTNILFAFVLLLVFILVAQPTEQLALIAGVGLALVVVLSIFMLGFLSLDAIIPATIVGTVAYGLGDLSTIAVLGVFFISASLLTLLNDHRSKKGGLYQSRRNGKQAWSNGWWFAIFLLLSYVTEAKGFSIAAISAIATATSDTWATEVGLFPRNHKTVSITNFKAVEPGTDGGISLYGTISALLGSSLIGAIYMMFSYEDHLMIFLIIALSGFIGCIIDSLLGATLQKDEVGLPFERLLGGEHAFGNNKVNWLATGLGGTIALVAYNLLV
jgi:uncharacterized protein (TIGR00297 family)